MQRALATAAITLGLYGCAHPVDLFVIDPETGEVGATQINARQTSGPIYLHLGGESYAGTWVSVRDTGYTSTGFGFTGSSFFTTAANAEADAGNAVANLRSASGGTLRCQIRYGFNQRILQVEVTGFGQCVDQDGRMYDVQGASTWSSSLRTALPSSSPAIGSAAPFPTVSSSGGR